MTEEQKKIDACKDQAAKKWSKSLPYEDFETAEQYASSSTLKEISNRAMQLYGEQCRKEGDTQPVEEQDIVDKIRDVFDVSDMRPEAIAEHLFHWFEFKRKH